MDRKDIMNNIPKYIKEDFNMRFSDNYMYFNTDSIDLKLSYYNILKIVDNNNVTNIISFCFNNIRIMPIAHINANTVSGIPRNDAYTLCKTLSQFIIELLEQTKILL